MQLAHHHALSPVDDKGPLRRHQGNFPHVDLLLLRALLVLVAEGHIERRTVGLTLALTLNRRHLRLSQLVTHKIQTGLLLKPENRKELPKDRLQSDAPTTRRLNVL